MDRTKSFFFLSSVAICFLTAGCSSTNVQRAEVEKLTDLSGRWNNSDARMMAANMIRDCLAQNWRPLFLAQKGRPPVVIVGEITNQSHEHINTAVFTKALEHGLLNSAKVKFAAAKAEFAETTGRQINSSVGTRKQLARETGADFMLSGSVNAVKDETKDRYVIMYQANLELMDLRSNEKVWIGEENIKKLVEKSKSSL